jgi:predicted ester cyclase
MSSENYQEVVRLVIEEGFNKGNVDILDRLYAPVFIEHQFGSKPSLESQKADIRFLRKAFPDLHLTIEEMVADGNKVWLRMTACGTNLGGFMGPPNGKPFTITVYDTVRLEEGRIVEHWGAPDRFALLAQLGLLPKSDSQSMRV